jgi:hypothetical protein
LIDLRNAAIQALQDQRAHTFLENDLIFHDSRYATGWHDTTRLARRWNQVLRKAGVRQRALWDGIEFSHPWSRVDGTDEALASPQCACPLLPHHP